MPESKQTHQDRDRFTKQRQIRMSDELWAAANARAKAEGTTASEVVRVLLRDYVANGLHVPL